MAAVLGGTQSLHVSGYDEAHDIPSEDAMRMSLNTQRIIGNETGVANTIDPLGGSFFIEKLTNEIEEEALAYIRTIEDMGGGEGVLTGMFAAIENGYIEREISEAAYDYQERIEEHEYKVLGLNEHEEDSVPPPELYEHDDDEEERQIARLEAVIHERDARPHRSRPRSPAAGRPRAPTTRCPSSSTPPAPTPPRARSWAPSETSSATTRTRASSSPVPSPLMGVNRRGVGPCHAERSAAESKHLSGDVHLLRGILRMGVTDASIHPYPVHPVHPCEFSP